MGECSQRPGPTRQALSQERFPPYCLQRPYGRGPQCSSSPVQGAVMEGADGQGAAAPHTPVRQDMYVAIGHDSTGTLLAKDSLERMVMKRIKKKNKEMRPRVSSSVGVQVETQKTLNHKMAMRQKQLRISPRPSLSRVGLSKCQLCTIIPFSHTTRRNECETAAIRNEQKIGAEDITCLLFAADQLLELSSLSVQHGFSKLSFPKDISFW
ncbi:hypothetical protein P7K49_035568 [Saguinus oedipus]|uniref:Uncharacterized protein n=1 Tax=Saguinus oedipus TaxID=9490 RepID=A0ABQ9TN34_SAGOE|nr:hypothetical protein P7K49_035568 [Saguinus oedipus]